MLNIKTIASLSIASVTVAATCWFASFNHPDLVNVEVIPEWNGPDLKISYKCKSSFVKMEGLDMQHHNDVVTVNYGALGRRRGGRTFKCNK